MDFPRYTPVRGVAECGAYGYILWQVGRDTCNTLMVVAESDWSTCSYLLTVDITGLYG